MPPTATKGSRNKFYSKIAAEARRAQTLTLTPISASASGSQLNRSAPWTRYENQAHSYSYSYSPLPSSTGAERQYVRGGSGESAQVRALPLDGEDIGHARVPTDNPESDQKRISIKIPNRSFWPHSRVQDWVDTTATPLQRPTRRLDSPHPLDSGDFPLASDQPSQSHNHSQSRNQAHSTSDKEEKEERGLKMEDDRLSGFQRFMARSMSPLPSAARRRGTPIPGPGSGADDRKSFFARPKYFDMTSPVPVLNLPIRERWTESSLSPQEVRKKKLENEKMAALKMYQEAERKLEEDAVAASHQDQHTTSALAEEVTELREDNKHLKELLREAQTVLETQQSQAARDQERSAHQVEDLQFALSQSEEAVDEERRKRGKAELESESSKKGQSAMARTAHDADVRAKEADMRTKEIEEKLKECGRRETIEKEKRVMAEKKLEKQAAEIATAQRNAEIYAQRAQEAYNAKDQALHKLRAVNTDCAKLTDKLNTVRLENESLHAQVVELTAQAQTHEDGVQDRKLLKEALHMEIKTANRLRGERNDLKKENEKLVSQNRRLRASSKAHSNRYDSTDLGSDIERPRSVSPTKMSTTSFGQVASALLPFRQHDAKSGQVDINEKEMKDTSTNDVISISDPDGADLPVQRVVLEDEQDHAEPLKSSAADDEMTFTLKPSTSALRTPLLSMSSFPLRPTPAQAFNLLGPEIHQKKKQDEPEGMAEGGIYGLSSNKTAERKAPSPFGLVDLEGATGGTNEGRNDRGSGMTESKSTVETESNHLANGLKPLDIDPFADIGAEYGLSLPQARPSLV
ncbi:hypothetical protein IAT40_006090 [Kwoniella sp. CBS 6097]